jgi:PAS domain S-box-containing protein
MKMTIRRKLGLSLLGAMLVASVIGGYIHYRSMVSEFREHLNILARTAGPLIEESLAHSMLTRDSAVLRNTLKNIVDLQSIERVLLVNNEGIVKAGTDTGDMGKKILLQAGEFPSAPGAGQLESDGAFRWIQEVRNRQECYRCHDSKSALNGRIIIDFSTEVLKKNAFRHMVRESTLIVGAIAFIGAFMFLLFDDMVIRRLGSLRESIRLFKEGAVETRVPLRRNDEITDLGAGFNEMASSVVAAQDDLKQYADELLSLAVSSNVVTAVPRTEDLYKAVCSIAVKELGLKMAWCGVLKQGCRDIAPAAQCGFDDGYLSSIKITWDDSPAGRGPTGMAIKSKTPQVMNELNQDPSYAIWKDEALKRGYESSMALPLLTSDGDVLGVLNLYSDTQGYFTRKRVRTFVVFANQVATAIENRALVENVEKTSRQIVEQFKTISRSHKEWQTTFDGITDLISIHDKDYNIRKANRAVADFFGLPLQEIVNKKCYEIFHGSCSPIANCPHRISLAEKRSATEEVRDPKSGKLFRVSTFPYYSPEGEFIGSIHVARDITEEKEKEMRLIMSQRLASLGQMASGVAHEINTPLASIAGCAEGLLMKVRNNRYDPKLFEEYLHIVEEEIIRCKSITTGMLSFVRTTTYEKKDISINGALDKALEIIGFQGRLRNVEVAKKYQAGLPTVFGSEGELRQVFLIILTNALDAMDNRGTLTIETGLAGNLVHIRISDTGPGIAQEHLNRIFDPFFTTKSDKGGTGLGLSIAYKIIANHNGTIVAHSEDGKGTTFSINLPLPE